MNKSLFIIPLAFLLFCSKVQGTSSEVVVSAKSGVYCLNGTDGSLRWSFPHPTVADSLHIWEQSGPAIGNMDTAANAEVVFGADKLYCLDLNDGSLKWSYAPASSAFWVCDPVMVNIDTTGNAEVLAATLNYLYCLNSNGGLIWSYPISASYTYPWAGPAITAEDIDGDGLPEALCTSASKIYCINSTGGLKWSYPMSGGNFESGIAVADVNADGQPDIIATANYEGATYTYYIYGLDANGNWEWSESNAALSSNPAIADINNDGKAEIVIHHSEPTNQGPPVTGSEVVVFQKDATGAYLDRKFGCSTADWTAVSTSCPILCDLEGTGAKDILWMGCTGFPGHNGTLYVFKGTNGSQLDTSDYFASQTINEHDVSVADIDGDSHVEVVGVDTTLQGISAIGCATWGSGRNLWTSHLYHITDINDDVTVPRKEPQSWKTHNTWLTQLTSGGSGFGTPTLKWRVEHPEFGEIYASIAIAPITNPGGVNESQGVNRSSNPQIVYEGNRVALVLSFDKTEEMSYKLFDIVGRPVGKQVSEILDKGQHKILLNSEELKNGIYFIQVNLGKETFTRKLVLVK